MTLLKRNDLNKDKSENVNAENYDSGKEDSETKTQQI